MAMLGSPCSSCCNPRPPDPPEECVCPDLCLYLAEVLEPKALGPLPRPVCTVGEISQPLGDLPCAGCAPLRDQNEIGAMIPYANVGISPDANTPFGGGLRAWTACSAEGEKVFGGVTEHPAWGVNIAATLLCTTTSSGATKFSIYATFSASVASRLVIPSIKTVLKSSFLELESSCYPRTTNTCFPVDPEFSPDRRAEWDGTSLTVDITWDSINGSAWQTFSVVDEEFFSDEEEEFILSCIDTITEASTAKFRFTKRAACSVVGCDCDANIDGLKVTFDGKEFTLGVGDFQSSTDGDFTDSWSHNKVFGFADRYEFLYTRINNLAAPGFGLVVEKKITIYCDTDDSADPPENRWFALFETICQEYGPGTGIFEGSTVLTKYTKRTEIGYFLCDKSLGCDERSEDEIIPVSGPVEIEEIDGSPETSPGIDPCEPPARPAIAISENCE